LKQKTDFSVYNHNKPSKYAHAHTQIHVQHFDKDLILGILI